MSVDVTTTAIDLRLGKECWVEVDPPRVCSWVNLHPTLFNSNIPDSKTDTPSSLGVFHSPDKAGSAFSPVSGMGHTAAK